MNGNGLEDDTDYGSNYKNKLHKKLFVKNEATDDSDHDSSQKREKKRKRKRIDNDIVESPKKKKIKLETESDRDTPKKKKKKKADASQLDESYDNVSNEDISQDYSNLNIKVEEELGLVTPTPKFKKQRRNTQSYSNTSLNYIEKNSNINGEIHENNTELHDTSCIVDNESFTKKKKSRKRQHSLCDNDDHARIVDKGTEDIALYSQLIETEPVENIKKPSVKKEKSKHKQEVKNEHHSSDKAELSGDDENQSHRSNHELKSHKKSIDNTTEIPDKPNKRVSRISDRIQFEDIDHTQIDTSIHKQSDNSYSRKLKKFLRNSQNLTQIPMREHSEWMINENDEIWAIRCPQIVDVNSFLDSNIKLDKKCKIKVDNQTYVGSMNNETASITVLSAEHNNYVIKKLPLSGTLHLHRKIPKVHVPDDNVILDNQTDFLPLPDTKNRHPLFGSNYKKAIKVPSAVAQRLNECYSVCDSIVEKAKKKKHKRDKTKKMNEQTEKPQEPASEDDNIIVSSKKKKKKRKHETESELNSPKHIKHSIDSSTVWESEQAIEENLFNF